MYLGAVHMPSLRDRSVNSYHELVLVSSVFILNPLFVYRTALFNIPSWVIQIEPQPMPTLRASTPASMRFLA